MNFIKIPRFSSDQSISLTFQKVAKIRWLIIIITVSTVCVAGSGACKRFEVPLQRRIQCPFFTFVPHSFSSQHSKWTLSQANYLTYLMCKKTFCYASQKCGKRDNWVTFFWLAENYDHFSYPKCGKVVTGPEIGKFGVEDGKCCTWKCNQCVTHLIPGYDPSITHPVIHLR